MLARVGLRAFPAGGGEMGALIRAFDWARTPLGPIESWPQSLRTAVDVVLRSPVSLVMLWGGDGIMIYNDAYSVFAGGRHPQLLGSKVLEGWPEVADLNRQVMEVGLRGRNAVFPRRAPGPVSSGPADRCLGRPRLQPAAGRKRQAGRRAGNRGGDDRAGARREGAARLAKRNSAPLPPPCRITCGRRSRTASSTGSTTRCSNTPARKPARLHGDGWGEVVHPEDVDALSRPGRRPWQAATVYEIEFRLRRSDGAYRWHLARAMPIRDDSRQGRALDRHQHRHRRSDPGRARAARPRGRSRARAADRQGRRRRGVSSTKASATAARLSISPSMVCRRKPPRRRTRTGCGASIPRTGRRPSGTSSTRSKAACAITTPNTASCARATGRCDGSRSRPRSSAMRDGRAQRLVGAHIDITDSKLAEAGRARERAALPPRLGKRTRHAVDGRCPGQVPLPQPHAARVLGRRAGRMSTISTGAHPCIPMTRQRSTPCSARPCASTCAFTVEARYRRCDGEYRLVRTDAQPRFGASGDFLGMIGVNVDITETTARRAGAEGERGALPADRQQRAGADVGEPARRQARLRQSGLHGLPWPRLRGVPGLSTGARRCTRTICIASWRSRSQVKDPGSRSRWRRGTGALTENGAGCVPSRSRAGGRSANTSASSASPMTHGRQAGRDRTARLERDAGGAGRGAHARARPHLECLAGHPGGRRSAGRVAQRQSGGHGDLGWSQADLAGRSSEWIEHPDDIARSRAELGASRRRRRHAAV